MDEKVKIPQVLYKYRDFSKPDQTLDILRKHELYFAAPSTFNDPFDCQINSSEIDKQDLAKFLAEKQNRLPGLAKDVIEGSIDDKDFMELIKLARDIAMNSCGVCSMASNPRNILMWSHYADKHTGICLGFDLAKDSQLFDYPIKMNYLENYPDVSFIKEDYSRALLESKYKGWEYEEEVRFYKREVGPHPFNPQALVEIFFGYKTSQVHIESVKEIISQRPELSHIKLKQLIPDEYEYRLIERDV